MINQDKVFKILETKGVALSNWLKENFNPHTAIIITATGIKIVETISCVPNLQETICKGKKR